MKKTITAIMTATILFAVAGCSGSHTQSSETSRVRTDFFEEPTETTTEEALTDTQPSLKQYVINGDISYIDYDLRTDASCIMDFTEDYYLYRTDYSYDIIKIKDDGFPELKQYFEDLADEYSKELEQEQQEDVEKYSRLKEDKRPKINRTISLEVVRSDSVVFSYYEVRNITTDHMDYLPNKDTGSPIYKLHTLSPSTGKELEFKDILRKDMSEFEKAFDAELYETAKTEYETYDNSDLTLDEFTKLYIANIRDDMGDQAVDFDIRPQGVKVSEVLIPYSKYPGLFLTEEDNGVTERSILRFYTSLAVDSDHTLDLSDKKYTVSLQRSEELQARQDQKNNNMDSPSGTDYYEEIPPYDSVSIDIDGRTETVNVGDYEILQSVFLAEKNGKEYLYLIIGYTDPITYVYEKHLTVIDINDKCSIVGTVDHLFDIQSSGDVIDPDRFSFIIDSDIRGSKYLRSLYKAGEDGMPVSSTGVYSFLAPNPVETVSVVTGKIVRDCKETAEQKSVEVLSYLIPYETDNSTWIDFICEDGDIIRLPMSRENGNITIDGKPMYDVLAKEKNVDWENLFSI